jgi:hypothetical protein
VEKTVEPKLAPDAVSPRQKELRSVTGYLRSIRTDKTYVKIS